LDPSSGWGIIFLSTQAPSWLSRPELLRAWGDDAGFASAMALAVMTIFMLSSLRTDALHWRLLLAPGPGAGPARAQGVEAPAVRTLPPRGPAGPAGTEAAPSASASGLPVSATGVATLPDAWLLGSGQPWHHRVPARADAPALAARAPTAEEAALISRLEALVPRIDARVVVLVDAGRVVDALGTGGIGWDTRLLSASMAKTLTALAVGPAGCAGKLTLDTRADAL
jgi:hypothetical protein